MKLDRTAVTALIVACAFFMEQLDGTVIATALPQMAQSFRDTPADVSIGMTAYLLTLAVFIPVSGWFADRFGSRTIFALAIVVFTVASVLCGLSPTLWAFVLARIVQGIGGAMMVPVGRVVVLRTADRSHIVRAMAYISTPGLVATVVGPPLGGFITTFASWRWIFFLNVPLGILGIFLALRLFSEHKGERRPFDVVGFLLSGTGLAALVDGLDLVGRPEGNRLLAAGILVVGLGIVWAAVRHAERHPTPAIDLRPLRFQSFATSVLMSGSLFRIVIGSGPFLWAVFLQVGLGMSAFASGLVIVACAVGDVAMKVVTTRILRLFGFRNILVINGVIFSFLFCTFATFTRVTPVPILLASLFAIGISRSVQFTTYNALSYCEIPPPLMSAASSIASTLQQLSFGMGIAVATLVLQLATHLDRSGDPASLDRFHISFVVVSLIALGSLAGTLRLRPDVGAEVSGHRPVDRRVAEPLRSGPA